VKVYVPGKKCLFGRQHSWGMALSAALNSNEGFTLPEDPKSVFWCAQCGVVDPSDAKAEA
jgi:hypothetical protein